jgi:antitoxin VapB|uniref:Antitoxin VapB36 n=1 Tax=Mycobacterium avium subsp. hominissuis TaxID=439334 RepID=A0A187NDV4_MYCAV|nr:antitoxin VapB36 [Mycobacterium avium subsp. hominissuis]
MQSRSNHADELLDVLRTEIWPLLEDRSAITKGEREQVLGYDPTSGVSL